MSRKKAEQGNRQWHIALYLRLSKEDRAKLQGASYSESIENQDKILSDFITRLRQDNPGEVFRVEGVYIDDGLTGTNTDKREEFNRMVEGILAGRVNCVLFKDLSRMFRNHTEQSHFLELFCPAHNVRVISINNKLDTYLDPDAVYGYDVTLTGVSNDRYCYTISKNVLRTFDMKRERGEFIGAFAPYGYRKDEGNRNKLVIDEEAAGVVRDIYLWYGSGAYSLAHIVRRLNDLGILCPSAYKKAQGLNYYSPFCKYKKSGWTSKTLREILSNQMYIGNMVQNRSRKLSYKIDKVERVPRDEWIIVEGTHEGIVSRDLFERVQGILALNTKARTKVHTEIRPEASTQVRPEAQDIRPEAPTKARANGISEKQDSRVRENALERDRNTGAKADGIWVESGQSPAPGAGHHQGSISLFAGLIFCAECGRALHRKQNKGSRYALYRCNSSARISETYCSFRGSVREHILAELVLSAVQLQMMTIGNLKAIAQRADAWGTEEQPAVIKLHRQYKKIASELEDTREKADGLYDDFRSGLISKAQYIRLKDRYSGDEKQKENILLNLIRQIETVQKEPSEENLVLEKIIEKGIADKLDRYLLLELVHRVKIDKNHQIEIIFKFQDPFFKKEY